jgi:hypothetical protein
MKDIDFYNKIGVSAPKLPYVERVRRRLAFRNDKNLYHRLCDVSKKQLISMYSNDSPQKIVEKDIWWSDSFEALDYGQDFDFSRPFFEQFYELMISVPHPNLITLNSENCEYTNYNGWNKNCYLCFAGNSLKDSAYCYNVENSMDCYDCMNLFQSELCYECVQSENLYGCVGCLHCKNCKNSYFLEDCIGCTNCVFCFNLVNKEYCILNKQYTKEEYEEYVKNLKLGSRENFKKAYDFWRAESLKYPKRALRNSNIENCTGEYISNSKNCFDSYHVHSDNQDCRYTFVGFPKLKDSYDCTFAGEDAELMYEVLGTGANSYNVQFAIIVLGSSNIFYSDYLINCKDCFGCSGLRNKQYCIFNKQYTKEQYFELKDKIVEHMKQIGEWGEFFPIQYSPFAYNETVAMEFFPLNKDQIFRWTDEMDSEGQYLGAEFEIPDNIIEVEDSITKQILKCKVSGKLYKVNQKEVEFYRNFSLPVPEICPNERHKRRFILKNMPWMYERKCDKCENMMVTTYAPERVEKVYCEKCYLDQAYG